MTEIRTVEDVYRWLASGHLKPERELPAGPDTDRRALELLRCFQQYPGALMTILEMSLFAPPVDFRLPGPEYRQYAQNRAGMNSLVATVIAYMAHAQTLEGNTDEPAPTELDDLALPGRWGDAGPATARRSGLSDAATAWLGGAAPSAGG